MTKLMRVLTVGFVALLVLGACGDDDPTIGTADTTAAPDVTGDAADTTVADDGGEEGIVLAAQLAGAAERPNPGDEDGSGEAAITIETTTNEICFQISVTGIEEATAAHVHEGGPDEAGPPVIDLTAPSGGSSEGCTAVEAELLNSLAENPQNYYVNVHNAEFPAGAVRGQLQAV